MFYYRLKRVTRATPKVSIVRYLQFGSTRHAGDYLAGVVAGGDFERIIFEPISQAGYRRGVAREGKP